MIPRVHSTPYAASHISIEVVYPLGTYGRCKASKGHLATLHHQGLQHSAIPLHQLLLLLDVKLRHSDSLRKIDSNEVPLESKLHSFAIGSAMMRMHAHQLNLQQRQNLDQYFFSSRFALTFFSYNRKTSLMSSSLSGLFFLE